jgi:hypothetical protein
MRAGRVAARRAGRAIGAVGATVIATRSQPVVVAQAATPATVSDDPLGVGGMIVDPDRLVLARDLGERQEHVLEALASGAQVGEGEVALGEPRGDRRDVRRCRRCVDPVLARRLLVDLGDEHLAQRGGVESGRGTEADVGVLVGRHQLGRGAGSRDATVVDDHDPVGDPFRFCQVVGGEQHRHPVGCEILHDLAHELAARHVDPGGRLVEERHLGSSDECQRQRQALLLSAGEVTPHRAGAMGETDSIQQLDRIVRVGEERGGQPEHLDGSDAGVDAAFLQHGTDPRGELVAIGDRVEPQHAHRPGGRAAEPLGGLDGRGLPCAVRAEQRDDLAVVHVERGTVDRRDVAVADDESVDLDGCHVPRRYCAPRSRRTPAPPGSGRPPNWVG